MPFDAGPAVKALQTFWYDSGLVGLYHWVDSNVPEIVKEVSALLPNVPNLLELYQQTERWWNSANAIGALIDYMWTTGDNTYSSVLDNTFGKAQNAFTITSWKLVPPGIDELQYTNFLNRFYDDEGWWALAWIKAYDLTRDQKFPNMAVTIGQDMITGWDALARVGQFPPTGTRGRSPGSHL